MKFYRYNEEQKIYIFILTLIENSDWRKRNVKRNIENNPKINVCHAVDASNEELVKKLIREFAIFLPERDPKWLKFRLYNYGRLGRWLSTIMLMKYSIDTNRKLIVMEDDLLLPKDFNFQFEKYVDSDEIAVLGEWGDAYFFTPEACKQFFENYLYKEGIQHNDDNAIIKEYKKVIRFSIISRNDYAVPMIDRGNEPSAVHKRDNKVDFSNVPVSKNMVLLEQRIFEHDDEPILEQFIKSI
mgnify:CR=1 FL=1